MLILFFNQNCDWLNTAIDYTCCHMKKHNIHCVYCKHKYFWVSPPEKSALKLWSIFFCCIWISKVFLFYFWKSIKIWMRSFVDECHLIVLFYIYCISCCFFCCSFCFWLFLVLWDFCVVVLAFSHFIIQLLKDIQQSGHSVSMFCQWK